VRPGREDPLTRVNGGASSSCVGRPGDSGTFNRLLGDRRSSVERGKG